MSDLVTTKEAHKLLGYKNPATTNAWLKKHKITKVNTLWARNEIIEKMNTQPRDTQPEKSKKPVTVAPTPTTFELSNKFALWNKGEYRGWAVGAVNEVSPMSVKVLTDYGRQYSWVNETLLQWAASGTLFFNDPAEVLQFMVIQLLRIKDTHPEYPRIIRALGIIADQLNQIKQDLT